MVHFARRFREALASLDKDGILDPAETRETLTLLLAAEKTKPPTAALGEMRPTPRLPRPW